MVEKVAFFEKCLPMIVSKIPNIFAVYVFVKETFFVVKETFLERGQPRILFKIRLQNSPYFCMFKYARAVKKKNRLFCSLVQNFQISFKSSFLSKRPWHCRLMMLFSQKEAV